MTKIHEDNDDNNYQNNDGAFQLTIELKTCHKKHQTGIAQYWGYWLSIQA